MQSLFIDAGVSQTQVITIPNKDTITNIRQALNCQTIERICVTIPGGDSGMHLSFWLDEEALFTDYPLYNVTASHIIQVIASHCGIDDLLLTKLVGPIVVTAEQDGSPVDLDEDTIFDMLAADLLEAEI